MPMKCYFFPLAEPPLSFGRCINLGLTISRGRFCWVIFMTWKVDLYIVHRKICYKFACKRLLLFLREINSFLERLRVCILRFSMLDAPSSILDPRFSRLETRTSRRSRRANRVSRIESRLSTYFWAVLYARLLHLKAWYKMIWINQRDSLQNQTHHANPQIAYHPTVLVG